MSPALYLSPFSGISLVAQGRFDEKDWTLRRQDSYVQANYGPVLAQVGYTFTRFDSNPSTCLSIPSRKYLPLSACG